MTGPEHYREAERLLSFSAGESDQDAHQDRLTAQVHATLAQAAATERLAKAVENLPTFEGMLAVYNFGGGQR